MGSNVVRLSAATDRDVEVINKYFSTGTVSIGSLCRKLPYLLLDLVGDTTDNWTVAVGYDSTERNFTTRISIDIADKFRIENSVTKHGVNEVNSLKMLEKEFEKDKFLKTPCTYAKIELVYNHNIYLYEKSKYMDTSGPRFVFKVINKTSLMRRLVNRLMPANNKISSVKIIKSLMAKD